METDLGGQRRWLPRFCRRIQGWADDLGTRGDASRWHEGNPENGVQEHQRRRIRLELGRVERRWEDVAGGVADPLQAAEVGAGFRKKLRLVSVPDNLSEYDNTRGSKNRGPLRISRLAGDLSGNARQPADRHQDIVWIRSADIFLCGSPASRPAFARDDPLFPLSATRRHASILARSGGDSVLDSIGTTPLVVEIISEGLGWDWLLARDLFPARRHGGDLRRHPRGHWFHAFCAGSARTGRHVWGSLARRASACNRRRNLRAGVVRRASGLRCVHPTC